MVMKKKLKELYELGAEAKREVGEATDKTVLELVEHNPGIVLTTLSKELGWSKGRVQGSVNRLERTNRVYSKIVLRQGKTMRRIYSSNYKEPSVGVIEIPAQLIDSKKWSNVAYLYATDRSTIMIESKEMNIESPIRMHVPIEWQNDKMVVRLPENFVKFYALANSEFGLSSLGEEGDNVLVTIEATIIPLSSDKNSKRHN